MRALASLGLIAATFAMRPCVARLNAQQRAAVTRAEAAEMVDVVGVYRQLVLQDSTPIDFCAVRHFFDEDGAFIGKRVLSRYARLSDCPKQPAVMPRNVVVTGFTRTPGRDVITSTTIRGNTRIFEQYVLLRGRTGDLRSDSYTVYAIVQN